MQCIIFILIIPESYMHATKLSCKTKIQGNKCERAFPTNSASSHHSQKWYFNYFQKMILRMSKINFINFLMFHPDTESQRSGSPFLIMGNCVKNIWIYISMWTFYMKDTELWSKMLSVFLRSWKIISSHSMWCGSWGNSVFYKIAWYLAGLIWSGAFGHWSQWYWCFLPRLNHLHSSQ